MAFPGRLTYPFGGFGVPITRRPRYSRPVPVRSGYVAQPDRWTLDGPQPEPEAEAFGAEPLVVPEPEPAPPATEPSPASAPAAEESAPDRQRLQDAFEELQAARRRVERDAERAKQELQSQLVARLFPVLDSLDRSIAPGADASALLEGVKLVRAQLEQVLADYGVERIESVGQLFDPAQHEAVDVVWVQNPLQDGRILQQWQAGYRFGDRVVRAARVQVAKRR